MLSGEMIDITRPLPVRTVDFGNGARNFPDSAAVPKKFTRMDVGPVFNLEDMLRKQAAKLKAEVKEASLKAAKAAEEAEKKLEDMVKMVVEETFSRPVMRQAFEGIQINNTLNLIDMGAPMELLNSKEEFHQPGLVRPKMVKLFN